MSIRTRTSNRSVGRLAVAPQKDRSAVACSEDHPAVTGEKDRTRVCTFTFADGRQCRTPRSPKHSYFCYFHARKEGHVHAADQIGHDISHFLSGPYLSACDLSSALGAVFAGVAQGHIKPKTASVLAYLGQTLVQSIHLSQHEFIQTFGPTGWRKSVAKSVNQNNAHRCDNENGNAPIRNSAPGLPPSHPAAVESQSTSDRPVDPRPLDAATQ